MGLWSFYFLVKLGLYFSGFIGFHWLPNLALAAFLLCPLPGRLRLLQHLAGVPAAIALFYFDSWLPPFMRLVAQAGALTSFSLDYLLELLTLYANPTVLAAAVLAFVLFQALRQHVRFSTFALLGILTVPLAGQISAAHPDGGAAQKEMAQLDPAAILSGFYEDEAKRRVALDPGGKPADFDIFVIHICSLAWDDLAYVNETGDSLLGRFDLVFKNFNSAASYSGPAAIRLLRSTCGQQPHAALYEPVDEGCYLFGSLAAAGYDVEALLNHDGHFDDFAQQLASMGGIGHKPADNRFAPVAMHSFDDTPIYDDLALLSGWVKKRDASQASRPSALYYNTISLHDGNQVPGIKSRLSRDTYRPRVSKLMTDLAKFIDLLEARGKPAVVLLVSEHGANLRGDKSQISGLREIPSPRITSVPAAAKLIGAKAEGQHAPLVVDKPTSYLALTTLLSAWLANSPFNTGLAGLQEAVEQLPESRSVSENEGVIVMDAGKGYVTRSGDGVWMPLAF